MPVNLYDVYKQVKQRKDKGSSENTKRLAERMIAAAKAVTESPTLDIVERFKNVELEWLAQPDINPRTKPLHGRFEWPIRGNDFVVEKPVYKNYHTGYDPAYGYVYLAVSSELPGYVKIGSTTNSPDIRVGQVRRVCQLNDLTLTEVAP